MEFQNLPLKRKLVGVTLVTSISVLALTCVVLFSFEIRNYKRTTERTLSSVAEIVASYSTAALMYDVHEEAQELLTGLRAEEEVVAAALYDRDGKLYAFYPTNQARSNFPATVGPTGGHFEQGRLNLFTPVIRNETRVGTLYLHGDLQGTYRRLRVYGLVLLSVLAGSGLVAVFLSNLFQRRISQPLLDLTNTAKLVSERKDYTVRVAKTTGDELGYLTEAFNSMLDQIQAGHSALRESEARLSAVFQQAGAGIALTDLEGHFLMVNERYGQILGRTREDLSKLRLPNLTHAEDLAKATPLLEDLLRNGKPCTLEMRHIRPGGECVWVRTTMVAIRNVEGHVESALAVSQDVTEQRAAAQNLQKARDEAVAASRAKDDFLAALSHELRTPLNPVLLLASEAANDDSLPAPARKDFETIVKNVALEARLIDDLLDLTSITRGKIVLEQTAVDVHGILQDVLDNVREEMELKDIVLSPRLTAERHTVFGDAVRLQQVFWNVLKNAVKFTPPGGRLIVETETRCDDSWVAVKIQDTGIGMTPSELDQIFEAFTQGEHVLHGNPHRFGGLGLGLAISRSLVELHSGRISAASAGRNQGSVFLIELPLVDAPSMTASDERSDSKFSAPLDGEERSLHILLVEDHEPTRSALARLLVRRNFRVSTADCVATARQLADREKFDLIVSDIGLPDGNGYELMAEFRSRFGLRGIALTGYGMEDDVARSREAGFATHLTKPVRVQALEEALNLVTGAASQS